MCCGIINKKACLFQINDPDAGLWMVRLRKCVLCLVVCVCVWFDRGRFLLQVGYGVPAVLAGLVGLNPHVTGGIN